jgi:hypothetical protein
VAQALRPFPQYLGINNEGGAISWSTYNSFQVKAQKHFSDGLSFLIGYTISKSISDINTNVPGYFAAASQDAYNHRAEKSLSNIDIPRSLIFNYTYELPVGPGKKFLNNNNPISKYVLGGWSIAGVHTYNSGFPLAISSQLTLPTMSAGALSPAVLRPDYTGSPIRTGKGCGGFDPATDLYLNASAFQAPAPWSFGNVPRTLPSTRSCGYSNENFSISKWFRFAESGRIQIGGNFFNLFNRHPWGIPDVNFSSASFGQMNSVNAGRSIQLNARIEF